jgi:Cof subfamily protein (haloacid dehalogenase superfamily)
VVLATGRPYTGVKSYLENLGMNQEKDFCITYNGALVQKANNGETVVKTTISYDDYRFLEKLSRKIGSHFQALDRQAIYTANRDISHYTVRDSFVANIALVFCEVENMRHDIELLKLMMIDEPSILDKAISQIPEDVKRKYTFLKSTPYYLEILNKKVDKGAGVRDLAESLDIYPEEIMAIGDQENDIAMIRYAGVGVAMGNAIDSVKEIADFTTCTNIEDGVARAIERFALVNI